MILIFATVFSVLFKHRVRGCPICFLAKEIVFSFCGTKAGNTVESVGEGTGLLGGVCIPGCVFSMDSVYCRFIGFLVSVMVLFLMVVLAKTSFR